MFLLLKILTIEKKKNFKQKINDHFVKEMNRYSNSLYLQQNNNIISLTEDGIFISDKITSDLFFIE